MFEYSHILNLLLAIAFGAAIGIEREICGKAAGIRTNVLICLGAALFTTISNTVGPQNDRITAQIVTGVGFLGAGAIIQDRGGIFGLTTAATIWLVAGIGIACGSEMYKIALVATIFAIIVLYGLAAIEANIKKTSKKHSKISTEKNKPPPLP